VRNLKYDLFFEMIIDPDFNTLRSPNSILVHLYLYDKNSFLSIFKSVEPFMQIVKYSLLCLFHHKLWMKFSLHCFDDLKSGLPDADISGSGQKLQMITYCYQSQSVANCCP